MLSAAMETAHSLHLCLLFSLVLAGCGAPVDAPQTGTYRATLKLPGGEAPFGLEVAKENNRFVLYLVNDTERTRVDNVTVADDELTAVFPGYENTLARKNVSRPPRRRRHADQGRRQGTGDPVRGATR